MRVGQLTSNRVEAFQRWLSVVADEDEGRQHSDMSLTARQVFNELKSDPSFSWLAQILQVDDSATTPVVSMSVAYRMLRCAAPQLSTSTLQSVVATLSALFDQRTHCLSSVQAVAQRSVGGDVMLSHLGLVLSSWVASRCCSLTDVVGTFSDVLHDALQMDCSRPAGPHCEDAMPQSDDWLDEWVLDRWLLEWVGDKDTLLGTPSVTQCSSPQRSARTSFHEAAAMHLGGADITPVRVHHFAATVSPVAGSLDDAVQLFSAEKTTRSLLRSNDDASPQAIGERWVASMKRVRQVLGVLLPHCPSPLLDHMIEDCVEDITANGTGAAPLLDLEWSLVHCVAGRWDRGMGASLSGSYVSTSAVAYFDATQWLLGPSTDGERSASNPGSFFRNVSILSSDHTPSLRHNTPKLDPAPSGAPGAADLSATAASPDGKLDDATTTARHRLSDPSKRYRVIEVADGNDDNSTGAAAESRASDTVVLSEPRTNKNSLRAVRIRTSTEDAVPDLDDEGRFPETSQPPVCACCAIM